MGKNTPQKLWNGIEPSTENVHSFGFATFSYGSSQNKKRRPLLYFIDPITPEMWENSPQKPLLATLQCFFGHRYVQNAQIP